MVKGVGFRVSTAKLHVSGAYTRRAVWMLLGLPEPLGEEVRHWETLLWSPGKHFHLCFAQFPRDTQTLDHLNPLRRLFAPALLDTAGFSSHSGPAGIVTTSLLWLFKCTLTEIKHNFILCSTVKDLLATGDFRIPDWMVETEMSHNVRATAFWVYSVT